MCGNVQEMVANGLCRPCHRSRSCETCHGVNFDVAARVCDRCSETRQMQGASQGRLAMWCATCNTPDQIAVELCKMCFDKQSRLGGCHHCRAAVDFSSRMLTCAETGCGVRMRFCCQCAAVFANYPDLSCKTCWHANGDICISCHRRTGQHHLDKYRHCKLCIRNIFCVECRAPPAANLVVRNCRMCSSLALWCVEHCTVLELQSRLCRTHLRTHGSQCQFCGFGGSIAGGAELLWQSCVVPDCPREVHVCEECNRGSRQCGFVCEPCWSQTDHKCVSCKALPARTELRFVRRCWACFSRDFLSREDTMVEEESKSYIRELSRHQEWDGTEPALQLLLLPHRLSSEQAQSQSLPQYADEPHFLSPLHCRL